MEIWVFVLIFVYVLMIPALVGGLILWLKEYKLRNILLIGVFPVLSTIPVVLIICMLAGTWWVDVLLLQTCCVLPFSIPVAIIGATMILKRLMAKQKSLKWLSLWYIAIPFLVYCGWMIEIQIIISRI